MKDYRCPFDEALISFKRFLKSEGWNDDLLWLNREHITGHRRKFFIFRPLDLTDISESAEFYEEIRKTKFNIRIDAFCEFEDRTIAYVSKLDGESELLNMGCPMEKDVDVTFIKNRFLWKMALRGSERRGISPPIKAMEIPRSSQHTQCLSRSALQA